VPNESRELKAGGFAKVAVLTHTDPQAPTVPVEAVVTFVGSIKVFVIQDGKAHAIEVTPGVSGRGWVEVQGKLPRDGRVITSGHDQLAEGTPVQIREASPNGGKPGERQPETTETQAGREQ
jgi:hypothetical protein